MYAMGPFGQLGYIQVLAGLPATEESASTSLLYETQVVRWYCDIDVMRTTSLEIRES